MILYLFYFSLFKKSPKNANFAQPNTQTYQKTVKNYPNTQVLSSKYTLNNNIQPSQNPTPHFQSTGLSVNQQASMPHNGIIVPQSFSFANQSPSLKIQSILGHTAPINIPIERNFAQQNTQNHQRIVQNDPNTHVLSSKYTINNNIQQKIQPSQITMPHFQSINEQASTQTHNGIIAPQSFPFPNQPISVQTPLGHTVPINIPIERNFQVPTQVLIAAILPDYLNEFRIYPPRNNEHNNNYRNNEIDIIDNIKTQESIKKLKFQKPIKNDKNKIITKKQKLKISNDNDDINSFGNNSASKIKQLKFEKKKSRKNIKNKNNKDQR